MTNEDSIYHIGLINKAANSDELIANLDAETVYPYRPDSCRVLVGNEVSIGTVASWRDDINDAIECVMERDLFRLMLSAAKQRLEALEDAAWMAKYDEVAI